jgi:hypothetical protein
MLYHGTQGLDSSRWKPGDTVRLPLTATAGETDAVNYGLTHLQVQKNAPTLIRFEKGTQMAAYAKVESDSRSDLGYNYSEAVVAGGFKVTKVEKAPYPWGQHFTEGQGGGVPNVTVVTLQQTETFTPGKGWGPR